ncbi:hypothetical protein [Scytonema millei]|nr:hypothetical protein [Scytonema millei]
MLINAPYYLWCVARQRTLLVDTISKKSDRISSSDLQKHYGKA